MTPQDAQHVADALRANLEAEVESEMINGRGRYRFSVVSPQFEDVPHRQRQDRVWATVDQVLARADTLDISMILAFAPSEMANV